MGQFHLGSHGLPYLLTSFISHPMTGIRLELLQWFGTHILQKDLGRCFGKKM